MAIKSDRAYRAEYMAILKACSDFGFSDTEDVPLSAIVRGAFSTLKSGSQPTGSEKDRDCLGYARILELCDEHGIVDTDMLKHALEDAERLRQMAGSEPP